MATDRLIAIVVMVITIGAAAFVAKLYQLPELYAVCGLLTYFLGSLTGKPTQKRIERSLRKLPPSELDKLYERVSGRPPQHSHQPPPPPVRLDNA
jgi:hypothetical protein